MGGDPAATADAALQNGEVDWWGFPSRSRAGAQEERQINLDIGDPIGNIGSFRMNHLHPPPSTM